jgi:serine/threonine-protein kinase
LTGFGKSVLKIGYYDSPLSLERIMREVEILSSIRSQYFPRNYDFKIVDNERYYILEEFLEGNTLKDGMPNFFTEKLAIDLIAELVVALRLLWEHGENGIVHRDLKPQNIIITRNGPRIIDLGIARFLDETSITQTWAQFGPGTPAYASPEQIENRKREIDFRSDQFNLGIIFAQLILNGCHPFSPDIVGNRESIVSNILNDKWAKKAVSENASSKTTQVITKMLGHQPYERYRKTKELQSSLEKLKG